MPCLDCVERQALNDRLLRHMARDRAVLLETLLQAIVRRDATIADFRRERRYRPRVKPQPPA